MAIGSQDISLEIQISVEQKGLIEEDARPGAGGPGHSLRKPESRFDAHFNLLHERVGKPANDTKHVPLVDRIQVFALDGRIVEQPGYSPVRRGDVDRKLRWLVRCPFVRCGYDGYDRRVQTAV